MERSKKMILLSIVLSIMAAVGTMEDNEECADQLTNLADCIPFVSGIAKKPTQQCCEDTQKVKSSKPKCLCVLIKESIDPSIGLPVNTTLALQMPSACNIDAKVSHCPSILNLPPDSPDAKIFEAATTTPPTDSPTALGSGSSLNSKATPSNNSEAKLNLLDTGRFLAVMTSIAWLFNI